jgi:hypothetical protein
MIDAAWRGFSFVAILDQPRIAGLDLPCLETIAQILDYLGVLRVRRGGELPGLPIK